MVFSLPMLSIVVHLSQREGKLINNGRIWTHHRKKPFYNRGALRTLSMTSHHQKSEKGTDVIIIFQYSDSEYWISESDFQEPVV